MRRITLKIQMMLLVIGLLLVAIVISAGFTLSRMNRIEAEIKTVIDANLPLNEIIMNIYTHKLEKAIWFERALHSVAAMNAGDKEAARKFARAQETFNRMASLIDDEIAKGQEMARAAIDGSHSNESQRALGTEVLTHLEVIEQKHVEYNGHVATLLEAIARGTVEDFEDTIEAIEAEEDRLHQELETFLRNNEQRATASLLHIRYAEETVILLMRSITVFSLIFGIAISILLMIVGFRKPIIVEMDDAGGIFTGHTWGHSHKRDKF